MQMSLWGLCPRRTHRGSRWHGCCITHTSLKTLGWFNQLLEGKPMKLKQRAQQGFTLIELMIVVA
ncbi:type II secretion system protein, partial [Aquabacterium sp. A08]|nr:type II secretion system protein [Aquabacterium sp. A08]